MNFLINGIFTLSYLATAVIVGFVVHRGGMVADPTAAIAIGVTVLLLGVLLHQAAARSRRDRVLVATISTMEQAQHRIEEQVASSRDDITILAAATEQAIRKAPQDDYDNIVAEVRTLETLVRQISDNPEGHEQPPFNLAVDAASAPVVPEDLDGERLLELIRDAPNNKRVAT